MGHGGPGQGAKPQFDWGRGRTAAHYAELRELGMGSVRRYLFAGPLASDLLGLLAEQFPRSAREPLDDLPPDNKVSDITDASRRLAHARRHDETPAVTDRRGRPATATIKPSR